MGQLDNVITLIQKAVAAAAVVIGANLTLTFFGQPVPLEVNAAIQMLISSGILYQFIQAVLNEMDGAKSTMVGSKPLGDTIMPFPTK